MENQKNPEENVLIQNTEVELKKEAAEVPPIQPIPPEPPPTSDSESNASQEADTSSETQEE